MDDASPTSPPDAPVPAADDPDPIPTGPVPAEPRRLARVALGLAVLALVAYTAAAILLTLPVRTPRVQDCGAPGAYLYDGRVDVVPDAENRVVEDGEVVTLPAPVADAARATPCQERIAARAVPAAGLALGATVVGAAAFAVELIAVRPRRRRARLPG